MEIDDISWNETTTKRFNSPLLPKSIRGLIIGKSGCGKTTLLLNLLLKPDWLDYDNLCVFGKSLFQPEYEILKNAFEENLPKDYILGLFKMKDAIQESEIPLSTIVQEWAKTIEDKSTSKCKFFETASDVPDPRELNPVDKNLMIFDDLLLSKQNKCEDYYIRSRHSNVDCFYLSQNYFLLPRQTIRENANFLCLFPQDGKNLNHIYDDHVGDDMTKKEFREFCRKCWEKPFSFVVIDLSSKKDEGKYRHGFDNFFIPPNKNGSETTRKDRKKHRTQNVVPNNSGNESSFNTMFSPSLELAR